MKQIQLVNAHKDLEKLSENENLSDINQWEIYKLRKMLRPHMDFQDERENAILEKYRVFADKEGNLDSKKSAEYIKEIQDLAQMEIEIEPFVKPKIKIVKGMTCKTMEPLEDFIEFTSPAE